MNCETHIQNFTTCNIYVSCSPNYALVSIPCFLLRNALSKLQGTSQNLKNFSQTARYSIQALGNKECYKHFPFRLQQLEVKIKLLLLNCPPHWSSFNLLNQTIYRDLSTRIFVFAISGRQVGEIRGKEVDNRDLEDYCKSIGACDMMQSGSGTVMNLPVIGYFGKHREHALLHRGSVGLNHQIPQSARAEFQTGSLPLHLP